jgi:hypothetical protein
MIGLLKRNGIARQLKRGTASNDLIRPNQRCGGPRLVPSSLGSYSGVSELAGGVAFHAQLIHSQTHRQKVFVSCHYIVLSQPSQGSSGDILGNTLRERV